jgi:hypothetical protein
MFAVYVSSSRWVNFFRTSIFAAAPSAPRPSRALVIFPRVTQRQDPLLLTRDNIECTTLISAATLNTKEDQAEWELGPFPPLGRRLSGIIITAVHLPDIPVRTVENVSEQPSSPVEKTVAQKPKSSNRRNLIIADAPENTGESIRL